VCGIRVRFRRKPPSNQATLQSLLAATTLDGQSVYRLEIVPWSEFFAIEYSTSELVAFIDEETSTKLRCIEVVSSVRFELYLTLDDWDKKYELCCSGRKARDTDAEITIYGSRVDAEEVGRKLSDVQMFLQRPMVHNDFAYENPHLLRFPELSAPGAVSEFEDILDLKRDTTPASREMIPSQFTRVDDFALILDNLPSHGLLEEIAIAERIKFPLLKHQKEGVDFILRREAGEPTGARSLWEPGGDDDGNDSSYRHVITGSKRTQPVPGPAGGILADDMGLGKSLTVLTSVLNTRASADKFARYDKQTAVPQRKSLSRATLIVVPSVLLAGNWIAEIQKHFDSNSPPKHFKYHGQDRHAELHKNLDSDVILTTYGTVVADFRLGTGPLKEILFFRIVLDEAHFIRSRASKQYQAVCSLSSKYRWCLTGTPIQNKLDDLGALVSFLRVPILKDPQSFRNHIVNADLSTQSNNLRLLLGSICLRRTNRLLPEPQPVLQQLDLHFNVTEKQEYDRLFEKQKQLYQMAISGHIFPRSQFIAAQMLIRLRLYCNHGSYDRKLVAANENQFSSDEYLTMLQQKDDAKCIYCGTSVLLIDASSDAASGTLASCGHLVCSICYKHLVQPYPLTEKASLTCPKCMNGEPLPSDDWTPKKLNVVLPESGTSMAIWDGGHSSKMAALLDNIISHMYTDKSIVFSSWKRSLDIVAMLLQRNDIAFLRVDGSTLVRERENALEMFNSCTNISVLLMTLGTGSIGLNLQNATRIHILEPQWNPGVERQAIGRANRIGQTKCVTVIRYVVKDTVEEVRDY